MGNIRKLHRVRDVLVAALETVSVSCGRWMCVSINHAADVDRNDNGEDADIREVAFKYILPYKPTLWEIEAIRERTMFCHTFDTSDHTHWGSWWPMTQAGHKMRKFVLQSAVQSVQDDILLAELLQDDHGVDPYLQTR